MADLDLIPSEVAILWTLILSAIHSHYWLPFRWAADSSIDCSIYEAIREISNKLLVKFADGLTWGWGTDRIHNFSINIHLSFLWDISDFSPNRTWPQPPTELPMDSAG